MIGDTNPAPVTIATVAEPCATRTNNEMRNATITIGKLDCAINSPITLPTPLSINVCLNTPPAPVIKMIIPAGSKALVAISCISLLV